MRVQQHRFRLPVDGDAPHGLGPVALPAAPKTKITSLWSLISFWTPNSKGRTVALELRYPVMFAE